MIQKLSRLEKEKNAASTFRIHISMSNRVAIGIEARELLAKLLRFSKIWGSAGRNRVAFKKWISVIFGHTETRRFYITETSEYELPDGTTLNINDVRYQCPEALFDPLRLGKEVEGVHKALHSSIMKCDSEITMDLYRNIVLSGGNTMFKVWEHFL